MSNLFERSSLLRSCKAHCIEEVALLVVPEEEEPRQIASLNPQILGTVAWKIARNDPLPSIVKNRMSF